jgi:hypothetical protein
MIPCCLNNHLKFKRQRLYCNHGKCHFGNHSAVRVLKTERENIRKFYCDVLGGKITRAFSDKDDICLGDDFYLGFLYGVGDEQGADQGVNYAAESSMSNDGFLKAIFLKLKRTMQKE